MARSTKAQLAAQEARIAQMKALAQLRRSQVETLKVLAGTNGVLQQMQVEVGQQVQPGAQLARGTQPAEYKQATVLFADVVHSMDIASTVGAEKG